LIIIYPDYFLVFKYTERSGNWSGSSFTGMMRQLGGSFGIAAITTFIANAGQKYRNNLISHLDENSFDVQQRLAALKPVL
jgi:hypothetical protein